MIFSQSILVILVAVALEEVAYLTVQTIYSRLVSQKVTYLKIDLCSPWTRKTKDKMSKFHGHRMFLAVQSVGKVRSWSKIRLNLGTRKTHWFGSRTFSVAVKTRG